MKEKKEEYLEKHGKGDNRIKKGSEDKVKQNLKSQDTLKSVLMSNCAFSEDMAHSVCDDTKKKMDKDF